MINGWQMIDLKASHEKWKKICCKTFNISNMGESALVSLVNAKNIVNMDCLLLDSKAVILVKEKVKIYHLLLKEVIIICLLLGLVVSVKIF